MKQNEIAKYLKYVTAGIGVLFFVFVVWFLPMMVKESASVSETAYWGICACIWLTSIPGFLCLRLFWGICVRIGNDRSFTDENAKALKKMSYLMLLDGGIYGIILIGICLTGWYEGRIGLTFGVILIFCIGIALAVVCAALSHLVYKASRMQEEQDLTI